MSIILLFVNSSIIVATHLTFGFDLDPWVTSVLGYIKYTIFSHISDRRKLIRYHSSYSAGRIKIILLPVNSAGHVNVHLTFSVNLDLAWVMLVIVYLRVAIRALGPFFSFLFFFRSLWLWNTLPTYSQDVRILLSLFPSSHHCYEPFCPKPSSSSAVPRLPSYTLLLLLDRLLVLPHAFTVNSHFLRCRMSFISHLPVDFTDLEP